MKKWRKVRDFPMYSVSSEGDVRNDRKGTFLKPMPSTSGYLYVQFVDKSGKHRTKYVHSLVAGAFLDRKEEQTQVDHINGDKHDNHLSNLRWTTVSENCLAFGREERAEARKRPVKAIHCSGNTIIFASRLEAAEHFQCHPAKIRYGTEYKKGSKKGWTFYKIERTSNAVSIDVVLGDEPIVV